MSPTLSPNSLSNFNLDPFAVSQQLPGMHFPSSFSCYQGLNFIEDCYQYSTMPPFFDSSAEPQMHKSRIIFSNKDIEDHTLSFDISSDNIHFDQIPDVAFPVFSPVDNLVPGLTASSQNMAWMSTSDFNQQFTIPSQPESCSVSPLVSPQPSPAITALLCLRAPRSSRPCG